MQCASRLQIHIRKSEYPGSSNPVRLHFAPNLLRRIQLRAVRRKQIQTHAPLETLYFGGYDTRFMDRMAIQNQEDGTITPFHQPFQETTNHLGIQSALFNHKSHFPAPIHRAEQIQPISRSGRAYDRRLPFYAPGRSRVIIAAQARFVSKPNLRPNSLGLSPNRRILILDPLPHSFGVLLVRPPKGLLWGYSQLRQQTTHRILAQPNPKLPINQNGDRLPRPQGERKFILPRIAAHDNPIHPTEVRAGKLAPTPPSFPGIQSIPATGSIHRQPIVNTRPAEAQGPDNFFWTLPTLDSGNRPFSEFGQNFMFQFAAIHFFHDRYSIRYDSNVYIIMDRLVTHLCALCGEIFFAWSATFAASRALYWVRAFLK